ncbi:hypothetical protein WL29_21495 [Burkholderia ubonensis]|uniref:Uncharacterized protein n=2 Tax=Burkholderia ubonensis TaxID=101571 RepID=A0A106QBI4_9BURK|nr:hypothetical protein WL29_21495 [Burkholderia ubonensis]
MKTIELAGTDLLEAVKLALRTSYAALDDKVSKMNIEQLRAYLAKQYPGVQLADEVDTSNPTHLRNVLLNLHEPLLAGEDDLVAAGDWDLWPLCEHLLDRYDISLSPRREVGTGHRVWLADDNDLRIAGDSAREAILRYYVTIKLGHEVNLPD